MRALRLLRLVPLVLQSLVLAVVVTWPTVQHLSTQAVGSAATDTPKHLWTLWWMRHEAWDGTWGALTTLANFPDGLPLYPIAPFDGIFAALLPMGPVALSNVLALLHVALLGLCAGWLGMETTRTRLGGHVVGALAQASAFTGFMLEVGVGELRAAWWIPLGLACLLRAHRTKTRGWFIALGLVLGGAVIACFYHGLFLALAVSVWAALTLRMHTRLLRGYALAAGLALVVALPVVRLFAGTYGGDAAQEQSFSLDVLPGGSVSVDELFVPHFGAPSATGRRYDGGRYLGIVTLALAAAGLATGRRRALPWVAVAGVATVLALGPTLLWSSEKVHLGSLVFHLPMRSLNAALAVVGEPIHFPARFVAPATIALAVLVAFATRRWPRLALLVPLAMVDTVTGDRAAFPRYTFSLEPLPGFAAAAGTGAVADLSIATNAEPEARNRSIAAQITLDRPFSGVPIERLSAWAGSGDRWLRLLPLTDAVTRVGAQVTGDPRADLWLLRTRGFDRVLLTHRGTNVDMRADQLLTSLCGEPVRTPHATLWTIPEVAPSPEQAAEWQAAQDARVASGR